MTSTVKQSILTALGRFGITDWNQIEAVEADKNFVETEDDYYYSPVIVWTALFVYTSVEDDDGNWRFVRARRNPDAECIYVRAR